MREVALALAEAGAREATAELFRRIERVEAEPPSRARERALAWLFLALARRLLASGRVREAQAAVWTALSYARTGGEPEVYRGGRELEGKLAGTRWASTGRRRKHRR